MDLCNFVRAYYNSTSNFDECCSLLHETPQQILRKAVKHVCHETKSTLSGQDINLVTLSIHTDKIIDKVKPQWETLNGTVHNLSEEAKAEKLRIYKIEHLHEKDRRAADFLKKKQARTARRDSTPRPR